MNCRYPGMSVCALLSPLNSWRFLFMFCIYIRFLYPTVVGLMVAWSWSCLFISRLRVDAWRFTSTSQYAFMGFFFFTSMTDHQTNLWLLLPPPPECGSYTSIYRPGHCVAATLHMSSISVENVQACRLNSSSKIIENE
jgi:hypothetical protein